MRIKMLGQSPISHMVLQGISEAMYIVNFGKSILNDLKSLKIT